MIINITILKNHNNVKYIIMIFEIIIIVIKLYFEIIFEFFDHNIAITIMNIAL